MRTLCDCRLGFFVALSLSSLLPIQTLLDADLDVAAAAGGGVAVS